jgi:hypothetical protein
MAATMRLPNTEHVSRPWRIHEIAPDFRLEDVWEFPGRLGPDDFPRAIELLAAYDTAESSSAAVRTLFALRWKLGALLGWDSPEAGVGSRVPTLCDRLPADLREKPGPDFASLPFTSLYLTDDEFAAEVANRTIQGILHIGQVPDATGGYRLQGAVLVRPNGLFGNAYMAAIRPFRHLIVYPALMREAREVWDAASAVSSGPRPPDSSGRQQGVGARG